jgi:hypothetical protein
MDQPANQPHKNNAPLITLVIVVIVVALGLAWYVQSRGNENTNVVVNTNEAANTNAVGSENTNIQKHSNINGVTNENANQSIAHADWRVYTSSDFGISLGYPNDWDTEYYMDPVRTAYYQDALVAARTSYTNSEGGQDYGELVVYGFHVSGVSSLRDWVTTERPVAEGVTVQNATSETINGYPAFKRTATSDVAGGYLISMFVQIDDAIVELQTNSRILTGDTANQESFNAVANEIIHTLQEI